MRKLGLHGWIATWFGSGLCPWAPGTAGTLAALPFAWVITLYAGTPGLLAAAGLAYTIGTWATHRYMHQHGKHDPGEIVIDEVAGVWLLLCAVPFNPYAYILGFLLFRVFDITKPWPASWADRKLHSAHGVMLDDILAACWGIFVIIALLNIPQLTPLMAVMGF